MVLARLAQALSPVLLSIIFRMLPRVMMFKTSAPKVPMLVLTNIRMCLLPVLIYIKIIICAMRIITCILIVPVSLYALSFPVLANWIVMIRIVHLSLIQVVPNTCLPLPLVQIILTRIVHQLT